MEANTKDSNLRLLREAAGMSQYDLARLIGERQSNIHYWETSGKLPRSNVLLPLANALGITVEELLGEPRPKRLLPSGRARQSFEQISALPRSQQKKILDVVDALLAQHATSDR